MLLVCRSGSGLGVFEFGVLFDVIMLSYCIMIYSGFGVYDLYFIVDGVYWFLFGSSSIVKYELQIEVIMYVFIFDGVILWCYDFVGSFVPALALNKGKWVLVVEQV